MHDYDFVLHRVEMVSFIFIFVCLASELIRSFGIGSDGGGDDRGGSDGGGGGGSSDVGGEDDDIAYVLHLTRICEVIWRGAGTHAWSMRQTAKRIPRIRSQN